MPVRRAIAAGLVATAAVAAVARPAAAYDPNYTHRWIARRAVDHLLALYPGRYDAILPYLEDFVAGVKDEDNELLDGDANVASLRVMRHFFRPSDRAGLTVDGRVYPSSLAWATSPDPTNEWGYDDAIAYYRAGDTAKAFFAIGHVTHLIQDATVPAHTHLDMHGPPDGDDYEGYCSSQMRSQHEGDLALPPAGAPLPDVASLEELFVLTARASYYRSLVPGALSDPEDGVASGVLAEMFPTIEVSWIDQGWQIPGVGDLGGAFWEDEAGLFYFKKNLVAGELERTGFQVASPEAMRFAANDRGRVLSASMAADLVPIAVLHSAAALKYFMDEIEGIEVDPPPPDAGPVTGSCPDASGCGEPAGCAAGGADRSGSAAFASAFLVAVALVARRRRGRAPRSP